jgi:hypothetical protein
LRWPFLCGNISAGGGASMFRKVAALLFIAFGLSACTSAYGEEILNLELLCEGKWRIKLNSPDLEDTYAKIFQDLIWAEFQKREETFSERISIKDNALGSSKKIPLRVTDTEILLDSTNLPSRLKKKFEAEGYGFKLVSIYASIDRLTGKLDARMEVDATGITTDKSEEKTVADIIKLVKAFEVDGQCQKLDPKKKLF